MIEMGKKYRTRDGRKWRTLCTDYRGGNPVVGCAEELNGKETLMVMPASGKVWPDGCESPNDLIEISPYEDWPIDAPAFFRDSCKDPWYPAHFSGIHSDGRPTAWFGGCTSHSAKIHSKHRQIPWAEARLASEFTPAAEERGE